MNPHQIPARVYPKEGRLPFEVLNGSPGYINLLDALNSWQLVLELQEATGMEAAASFKHVSPAGAAVAVPLTCELERAYFVEGMELSPVATAYARARGADRVSSFGDFAAVSGTVDISLARLLAREVSDGIIAPSYDSEALEILKGKRKGKYTILQIDKDYRAPSVERREVFGVIFEQRRNEVPATEGLFTSVVTEDKELDESARRDLTIATIAVKYTQSNSVCVARDGQTIGVGAGQQSRVHCVRLACSKADHWYMRQHQRVLELPFKDGLRLPELNNGIDGFLSEDITGAELEYWKGLFTEVPERFSRDEKDGWVEKQEGAALSSDAFFPFRDSIDRAAKSRVRYVVEPGGSMRDQDVIDAANSYGMVMCFSKLRLFHH